jgi:hypothetical protein
LKYIFFYYLNYFYIKKENEKCCIIKKNAREKKENEKYYLIKKNKEILKYINKDKQTVYRIDDFKGINNDPPIEI